MEAPFVQREDQETLLSFLCRRLLSGTISIWPYGQPSSASSSSNLPPSSQAMASSAPTSIPAPADSVVARGRRASKVAAMDGETWCCSSFAANHTRRCYQQHVGGAACCGRRCYYRRADGVATSSVAIYNGSTSGKQCCYKGGTPVLQR